MSDGMQDTMQKRMSRTIHALSKIEGNANSIPATTPGNTFQQLKDNCLSDNCIDEDEETLLKITGSSSKSIYSGAGIKLEAFDSFHKVLNRCVCDFTFTIADAAFILKLLTPDIIRRILPLLISPAASNKKRSLTPKRREEHSEYGEEALDYEISEINKEQKEGSNDNNVKTAVLMTKRPDAPRPSARSSPGSNSCSPVSAAVQALISISAPLTDNTISPPSISHTKLSKSNDVVEVEIIEGGKFSDEAVFRPLSKASPCSGNDFSENVVAPVPKAAIVSCSKDVTSNGLSKDTSVCSKSSIMSHDEVNETTNAKRVALSLSEVPTTAVIVSATVSEPLSNQVHTTPDSLHPTPDSLHPKLPASTLSIEGPSSSIGSGTFPKQVEPENHTRISPTTLLQDDFGQGKSPCTSAQTTLAHTISQQTTLPHTISQQSTLAHADPLLTPYDLLLNTPSMTVDIPCGLHSPFTHALPASPMQSIINVQLEASHITTSIKDPLPTVSLINNNLPNPIVPQTSTPSSISSHISQEVPMSSILSSPLSNTESEGSFMDQSETFVADEVIASTAVRIQNPLRTILPKPTTEQSSIGMPMVSVLSMSNAVSNSISQISPIIKIEEKKLMQYGNSVPPNQIFTKISPMVASSNIMTPTTLAVIPAAQQRQVFQNQMCYFSPQGMDAFIFPQTKESLKNLFSLNNQNIGPHVIKAKTSNNENEFAGQDEIKISTHIARPENGGGGNLEVASALLSMASEKDSTSDKQDSEETFQAIILNSLKAEGSNVQVIFTGSGTAKIKDVEISPQEHGIKKDNFTCGKCQHVFTSVLYLTRHIKRVCPDMSQRKWKCDRCSKAFRHPFGLQQHIYTHTGERPHKCTHCSKAFYSSNDLRRHVRTHSGERPYQCSVCDKSFSTTISLKTHQFIHTGERPHKCPHCIKTFATSSKLTRHIVTHSEKRPYPCDQCAKTFNRSGDLRRHYQQHGNVHELLECDHCNKVFATQKCLLNHKSTHNRDIEATLPPSHLTENQDILTRTYDVSRF